MHDAHAAPAAAGGSFDDHGKSDLARHGQRLSLRLQSGRTTGNNRHAGCFHRAPRFNFLAHQLNNVRARTDKFDVAGFADFGEVGRLSQKPVARVDRVNVEYFGRADDRGNVEVALGRRRGPDAGRLVGKAHVQRISVNVAVHGDGADTHLFAGPDNSAGDLAAVGDQDLAKSSWAVVHNIANLQFPISKFQLASFRRSPFFKLAIGNWRSQMPLGLDSEKGLSVLDRLAVLDVNLDHFARGLGLNLVHQLHCFDNANDRGGLDFAADTHKAFGRGRGRAIEGADDGRSNNV